MPAVEGSEAGVLPPGLARPQGVGMARRAPHPNAALLFYEYLLGDAQQYFVSMNYVPSNTKVASPLKGVKILQAAAQQGLVDKVSGRAPPR